MTNNVKTENHPLGLEGGQSGFNEVMEVEASLLQVEE